MSESHFLSMSSILSYFIEHMKQLKKGEIAYKDGHILKFQADLEQSIIVGEVKPSMKNNPYKVSLLLNNGIITDSQCSCPRGAVICHHMAALSLYAHYNLSSTDKACSWSVRPPNVVNNLKSIKDMYGTYNNPDTSLAEVDFENFKKSLSDLSVPVGFSWLLKPEPNIDELQLKYVLPSIDSVVQDCKSLVEHKHFEAVKSYVASKLQISDYIIEQIAKDTDGQSENPLWYNYRKNRITASKFGSILAACKKNKYSTSLFKSLENNTNITSVHAVQWGITNEASGIKVLEENENVQVISTGLWLSNNGFLGASSDGLVNLNHIVEVKCPWKFRNKNLETEIEKDHSYIVYKENNMILVNKTHIYWDQIQGQLYLTKRKLCYLVVWTPSQTIITEIEKDAEWKVNLDILENFFITRYIPFLTHK